MSVRDLQAAMKVAIRLEDLETALRLDALLVAARKRATRERDFETASDIDSGIRKCGLVWGALRSVNETEGAL